MKMQTENIKIETPKPNNGVLNKLKIEDFSIHDWYRFVLSFPPHLVRDCLKRFRLDSSKVVLDPFCGTGTTLVECRKNGVQSIGIERNPMACFASEVKVAWNVDPDGLMAHTCQVAKLTLDKLKSEGIDDSQDLPLFKNIRKPIVRFSVLSSDAEKLLLKNSMSFLPLRKTMALLETLEECKDDRFYKHERLALAKTIVYGASNLRFGPEVGLGPIRQNAPVVDLWLNAVRVMAEDLKNLDCKTRVPTTVHCADSRFLGRVLESNSVDAVITSPPYPNEKDYTRTTRLESVLLGFVRDKQDLRTIKENLIRSNTRNVYKGDADDQWVSGHGEIRRLAELIEERRIKLGKTSGFERLYARVTKLYFGGMARHLSGLRSVLRPGAQLAYVVGDQASYLQVMIRTGKLLADIAESLGYEVTGAELFRTRFATATKEELREEVILLRWSNRGRKINLEGAP